jgi:hypothetical protein
MVDRLEDDRALTPALQTVCGCSKRANHRASELTEVFSVREETEKTLCVSDVSVPLWFALLAADKQLPLIESHLSF